MLVMAPLTAAPTEPRDHALDACFLGPYGENDSLLEKLLVEFLRDHVYWRRNFHPEDPPAITTAAARHPDYLEFEARMRGELHRLSAALKKSVPFHSPRYLGHMVSDLLLPGLAAQILTLPYNPNNVTEDAAPVTVDMEVQVGLQLARMVGYPDDPAQPACAFGHLTSGGSLGTDAGKFRSFDTQTHESAHAMGEAAARGDGQAVIAAFAKVQQSCLGCHQNFRTSFREHFDAQR